MKLKNIKTITYALVVIAMLTSQYIINTATSETTQTEHIQGLKNLTILISTNKQKYHWIDDPVNITISIENQGDEIITLQFPTTKQGDFVVKNSLKKKIFQWSDEKYFYQWITTLTIKPGESIKQNFTWDQKGRYCTLGRYHYLLPGTYTITGLLKPMDTKGLELYEATVKIHISLF